jgi:hypothetical protein
MPMPPASTTAVDSGRTSARSRRQSSSPSRSQGGSASASVRASTCARAAAPSSVKRSDASSQPRSRRRPTAASHCSDVQPRRLRSGSRVQASPCATWRTAASSPETPSATRTRRVRHRGAPGAWVGRLTAAGAGDSGHSMVRLFAAFSVSGRRACTPRSPRTRQCTARAWLRRVEQRAAHAAPHSARSAPPPPGLDDLGRRRRSPRVRSRELTTGGAKSEEVATTPGGRRRRRRRRGART